MPMKTIKTLKIERTSHFGEASHQNIPGKYTPENKLSEYQKQRILFLSIKEAIVLTKRPKANYNVYKEIFYTHTKVQKTNLESKYQINQKT